MKKKILALLIFAVITFSLFLGILFLPYALANIHEKEINKKEETYILEFELPTKNAGPTGLTSDSEGNIWFVEQNSSKIAVFFIKNNTFKEFSFRIERTEKEGIEYVAMSRIEYDEKREKIWFTWSPANSIVEFDLKTFKFNFYRVPTKEAGVFDILVDENGTIWFTEIFGNKIGKFIPEKRNFEEFINPSPYGGPAKIVIDSKGRIWYTQAYRHKIGMLDQKSKNITEYIPSNFILGSPVGIDVYKDEIWIADHGSSIFCKFIPNNLTWKRYLTYKPVYGDFPESLINEIKIDSKGKVWFVSHYGNRIGKFDPKNLILTEFKIPTEKSDTLWLHIDKYDNIWFTETTGNKIGLIPNSTEIPLFVKTKTESLYFLTEKIEEINVNLKIKSKEEIKVKFDVNINDISLREYIYIKNIKEVQLKKYEEKNLDIKIKFNKEIPVGEYILTVNLISLNFIISIQIFIEILKESFEFPIIILVSIVPLISMILLFIFLKKFVFKQK